MAGRTIKLPERRPMDALERTYVREMVRGLKVTGGKWLTNLVSPHDRNVDVLEREGPSEVTTIEYPEEKAPLPPGYRAMHRLTYREDDRPRCVACYMCSTACPANCIYIEAGEYEDDPIEKYPVRFEIDELKCIVCGFCVEACPKDAIRMDTTWPAKSTVDRGAAIWSRDQLLGNSKPTGPTIPEGIGETRREESREHAKYLMKRGDRPSGDPEDLEERLGPDPRR
jgi:NADH-quinone oxidoreductase subunit I